MCVCAIKGKLVPMYCTCTCVIWESRYYSNMAVGVGLVGPVFTGPIFQPNSLFYF